MNTTSWNRVKEIFDDALKQPAAELAAYLDSACAADHEVRQEVESLLAVDLSVVRFLEYPFSFRDAGTPAPLPPEQTIGPPAERPRQRIGVVYLAARADEEYTRGERRAKSTPSELPVQQLTSG